MRAISIKINKARRSAPDSFQGWVVPETDDLLAIDERTPVSADGLIAAEWVITHLPTGNSIVRAPYTNASTRERAAEIAQAFFRECKARGWPLTSRSSADIVAAHNTLPPDKKKVFWRSVAGWSDE